MEVQLRCSALKEKVTVQLQQASSPPERGEVLIAALYELSRRVLPELGRPVRSRNYQEELAAVLELVSVIAIPLIRDPAPDSRGVAVLTEIAEGCLDQLLKKKLSVYAQELLAKPLSVNPGQAKKVRRPVPLLLGIVSAAALALYLPVQAPPSATKGLAAAPEAALTSPGSQLVYQAAAIPPALEEPAGPVAGGTRERTEAAAAVVPTVEHPLTPKAPCRRNRPPRSRSPIIRCWFRYY